MLPQTTDYLNSDNASKQYTVLPTRTYNVDFENKTISGKVEDKDSVIQFIQKVFMVDKYAYEIYDWYYGNEIIKLIGKPMPYVIAEIPRVIREALLTDDRITEVIDFVINQTNVDSLHVNFTVNTVYGQLPYELEVNV